MSLKSLDKDKLKDTAMIDLAIIILKDEKKAMDFHGLYDQIAEIKQLTPEQKDDLFVQFYTDLNLDGRFLTLGSNMWGLKRWYPVEQIDEEITAEPKKKKTKKKKAAKKKVIDDDLDMEEIVSSENTQEDPFLDDQFDDEEDYDDFDDDVDEEEYDDFDVDEDDEEFDEESEDEEEEK